MKTTVTTTKRQTGTKKTATKKAALKKGSVAAILKATAEFRKKNIDLSYLSR